MKPERWHDIERLYHDALARGPDDRTAFLDGACADEAVRREVESLLAHDEPAARFMSRPPGELAAEMLATEPSASPIGTSIDRYRIVDLLGHGGMGEVYLAVDTRLDRKVAVKVLPGAFAGDGERLRRFEREARSASALNHPNILTIHEIGEAPAGAGSRYIVAEYVEGETVRELVRRGPLGPSAALDVARQVASALEAAHAAGIVHRDIKPENVIVRPDGLVKVLDFGLAKLADRPAGLSDRQAAALEPSLLSTTPGAVMGTVYYMSPEQARGLEVDHRADIFSLGVMLYEMLTGRRPFEGATANEVTAAILEREPAALGTLVPPGLERALGRMLAKEPAARYESASELRADLQGLRDAEGAPAAPRRRARGRWLAATVGLALVALAPAATWLWYPASPAGGPARLETLAVLPLRSLGAGADQEYLGLGIADTIITRVSRIGGLTVRPTSAVRKYVDPEVDPLEVGRRLRVDAVLDGSVQRAGDRLRVNVSLLRVEDAALLWAESFDLPADDIFTVQDEVSRQVASRLRVSLTSSEEARLARRETASPEAYHYYAKGVYHFSNRDWADETRGESDQATELFKKAIEHDPGYALAHAQLGYAYAWTAIVFEEDDPALVEQAKREINTAETLDPQLADVHVARAFILWSQYEGWQVDAAIRELRLAQRLDPNVGHFELADVYAHIGLDEQHEREIELALELDPTGDTLKLTQTYMKFMRALPDEGLAATQRHFNEGPSARYYLEKGMLVEAAPLVEEELRRDPDDVWARDQWVLLLALQGRHREAAAHLPALLAGTHRVQRRGYHHVTYTAARVHALAGRREEAVRWLRETAGDGLPNYTLFLRDPYLDPIRSDPAFVRFMAEMKTRWEGYRRAFG
jgi:TolB-like protein